ncbi:1504_t:CDS:2, partial [Paraglomus occultum]
GETFITRRHRTEWESGFYVPSFFSRPQHPSAPRHYDLPRLDPPLLIGSPLFIISTPLESSPCTYDDERFASLLDVPRVALGRIAFKGGAYAAMSALNECE